MVPRTTGFDWNRARAFLVTAETGSLSAAARTLGLTQPTLSRQVAALERELGVALFERGSRGLELTPNGLKLVEYVQAMNAAADHLSLAAAGQSESLLGNVCISASEVMATLILPPVLSQLRRIEPGITIELVVSNRASDLRRREADIAIRSFRPDQPDLITKKLREDCIKLYAAKTYLRQTGNPKSGAQLGKLDFVGFDKSRHFLSMLNSAGIEATEKNLTVTTSNSLANWELVKRGMGVGMMMQEIGDTEPLVQPLLAETPLTTIDTWLVAHRELRTSRRLKTVFDYLSEALQKS